MIIISNKTTDPYFNLASEEFLLRNTDEDCFMLWQNDKSVIVGINQNAVSEIDRDYTEANNIKVVRRLTGGGAVFHDIGNVNFTYITKAGNASIGDYSSFTKDIIDYLATLGVSASLSGRNDILTNGRKFTGNAQCIKFGKFMHHGCILYSADLSQLSYSLKVSKAKIESKGIKSVSSRVVNLCDVIDDPPSVSDFIKGLENFMKKRYNCGVRSFSKDEIAGIEKLKNEKYSSYEWNFGYSPDYDYNKSIRFPYGSVELSLKVSEGIIKKANFTGDFFSELNIKELEKLFEEKSHKKSEIEAILSSVCIDRYIKGSSDEDILKLFI